MIKLRAMRKRIFHKRMRAVEAQFLADVSAMRLDGARADEQGRGYIIGRFVICDHFQNGAFGRREAFNSMLLAGGSAAAIDEIRSHGRAGVMSSGDDRFDPRDDVCDGAVFQDITSGPGVERLVHEALFAMDCQKDDFDRELPLADEARDLETVQTRHIDVEQDDARHQLLYLFESLLPVACLRDYFQGRVVFDDLAQTLPPNWMIIGDQDLYLISHYFSPYTTI